MILDKIYSKIHVLEIFDLNFLSVGSIQAFVFRTMLGPSNLLALDHTILGFAGT
jgi:hypothetical protein